MMFPCVRNWKTGLLLFAALALLITCFACGNGSGGDDDDDVQADDDAGPADDDQLDDDIADDDIADDDEIDDDAVDDDLVDDDSVDDDTFCPDADEDGYQDEACGGADCNDQDPEINPDAYDICGDKIDNNCDDIVDNPDDVYVELPEFILGVVQGDAETVHFLEELGVRYCRPTISWKSVQPEVPDPNLTRQDIFDHPEMIDDLIDTADWTNIDGKMLEMLSHGITPFPIVGHGYASAHSMINGEKASPKRLGREHYLAYMYLYVRAVVERYDGDGYKDAEGIVLKYWQIENELNQALATAIWGWRDPVWLEALLSPWASWRFCTELLDTLNQAVHDSDPEAVTTQNLHTDIHPNLSRLILQPSWIEAATLWRDHMDLIGFDAYPNYYIAEPVYGTVVGERVAMLLEAGCGKPVIGLEIGYPTGPEELGYSWDNQAQYLDEAFHSSYEAGIAGYFHFGLRSSDTHSVTITPEDIENLLTIAPLFTEGRALPLLLWALFNLDYINGHFLDVVKGVEGYWGLVHSPDTRKPSFYVLQSIADEVYGE